MVLVTGARGAECAEEEARTATEGRRRGSCAKAPLTSAGLAAHEPRQLWRTARLPPAGRRDSSPPSDVAADGEQPAQGVGYRPGDPPGACPCCGARPSTTLPY